MKIPFSPPYIDQFVIDQVISTLKNKWITTGPKVEILEKKISEYYGFDFCVGVNSWTSGAILLLKWLGVKENDEVIIPAYTYAATALAIIHAGAKPVIVDVDNDFNIDINEVKKNINNKTKAIMGVDIAGYQAKHGEIIEILKTEEFMSKFKPSNNIQSNIGRPLVIADSAHSLGGKFKPIADFHIFSLHAVKNFTTAEGGMIASNLKNIFNLNDLKKKIKRLTLNGQTKDAFTKSKDGSWKYDIVEAGLKCNLPDINAAIALGQLKSKEKIIKKRKEIFKSYQSFFSKFVWSELPPFEEELNCIESSCHIYMLRIIGINEKKRDLIINKLFERGINVNVHYIPLPLLTYFKNLGYKIKNTPNSYDIYSREISLPIYPSLKEKEVLYICENVSSIVEELI